MVLSVAVAIVTRYIFVWLHGMTFTQSYQIYKNDSITYLATGILENVNGGIISFCRQVDFCIF